MEFARFVRELLGAIFAEIQYRYYRAAYRHCGDAHPDSWLIARRMTMAQLRVTDFLRRHVH